MKKFSYSSSGVSINKGNKFVSQIKRLIQKDKYLKKSNIGGFSGQFALDPKIRKPNQNEGDETSHQKNKKGGRTSIFLGRNNE